MKKFFEDRKEFRYSYELLRQVVYGGRVPRAETLLSILQSMRFSPTQIHKLMEFHFGGYPGRKTELPARGRGIPEQGGPEQARHGKAGEGSKAMDDGTVPADLAGIQNELLPDSPEEIASSLKVSLPKIPLKGNEDFWDMARALSHQAERKVSRLAGKEADQPLLFEKEPEAIYQFLVRKGKIPSFMSKGEPLALGFAEGIDYRDRFRGALLGAAVGESLGRATQGLSPGDIQELFGRIDRESAPAPESRTGQDHASPACLLLAEALLAARMLDPGKVADEYAKSRRLPGTGSHAEFSRNLVDRGFPWFESGAAAPESAPAARIAPIALLRAGDFRRLKLEAGIEASITHPHPASIAGAIAQAAAVARVLHTPAGALDVLGFARGLSHVVAGVESERGTKGKSGRPGPTLWRRLGTELTALLLRRAEIEEVQEALGNGTSAPEGVPFAWACFLRRPEDFAASVLSAVNLGNDAEANGSMAGSLAGAYLGARAIPKPFLGGLPWRENLEAAADGLLVLARRET